MSCENFFCTWGCQKKVKANSWDHSDSESIPANNVSKIGSKTLVRTLASNKRIAKSPKVPNIRVIDSVLNKASINLWRCTGMIFITCKGYKDFRSMHDFHVLQTVYCFCFVQQPWNVGSYFSTYYAFLSLRNICGKTT